MNSFNTQEIKLRLGNIQILDYRGVDIVEAHRRLGEEVSVQAIRILETRILNLDSIGLKKEMEFAKQILRNLKEKSESPRIHSSIRSAAKMYLRCVSAWAHGADLESSSIKNGVDMKVSPETLAIMLQNDNSGCQTGVLRRDNKSVVIWHTEEDEKSRLGERFDKLRIAIFRSGLGPEAVDIYSFIYPDLLPGGAFSWRSDGYLQAVDSIYLEQDENAFMLANIICWLTLVLGQDISAQALLNSLKPISDGYALNIVLNKDDSPMAEKIEFARDEYVLSILPDTQNSFLFQANLFSEVVPAHLSQFQDISNDEEMEYRKRQERTTRYLSNISSPISILEIHNLLTSQEGSPYCYASAWVKSYVIANLTHNEFKVWVGAGPALRNDELHQFSYDL